MKVLILEDDKHRIDAFKEKLENDSNELYITNYANQVISWLKHNDFDYIFLDHDLGDVKLSWEKENCGMTVAKYLNEFPQKNATVIVHSLNTPCAKEMVDLIEGAKHIPFVWKNISL